MNNNELEISVSTANSETTLYHKGQDVKFINVLSYFSVNSPDLFVEPQKKSYDITTDIDFVLLLNYEKYSSSSESREYDIYEGFAPIYRSENLTCDIFRREVSVKEVGGKLVLDKPLTQLELITDGLQDFYFKDYKISNNRTYQYVFYPTISNDLLVRQEQIVKTKWDSWSITELHPIDSTGSNFYATQNDVWLFKLNVETGDQEQNFTRKENITLGQYPRYYEGRQNYVSGSVSCLLGSEMVSAQYLIENGFSADDGEYLEFRKFDTHPTSNQRADMLNSWRNLVKSKNPKLLKDRKGQVFVVTITQNSNKPYDNIKNQPDVINFTWTEIKSVDDIKIINVSN